MRNTFRYTHAYSISAWWHYISHVSHCNTLFVALIRIETTIICSNIRPITGFHCVALQVENNKYRYLLLIRQSVTSQDIKKLRRRITRNRVNNAGRRHDVTQTNYIQSSRTCVPSPGQATRRAMTSKENRHHVSSYRTQNCFHVRAVLSNCGEPRRL